MKHTYEECYDAAMQCLYIGEFKKKYNQLYQYSSRYGWTEDFTWLKRKKKPADYWTKELAIKESKKYKTKAELKEKNQYVYNLSLKMGWIDEFSWLETRCLLDKEECFKRARNYSSVKDFNTNDTRAYQKSLENGWLEEMPWLEPTTGTASNPFWTFEKVKEAASLCKSRQEFNTKYPGASGMARRKGWYNKLGLPEFIVKENIYCVYSYCWDEQVTSYIGLTCRKKERNDEHHGKGKYSDNPYKSPVYRFAKKNNLLIPEPKYHGEDLFLSEAQALEDKIKNEYVMHSFKVLNKGKTGVGIGSYGNVGIKWSYENVFHEAMKYKTSGEFLKSSPSAYDAAHRNKWLKDYNWMKFGRKKIDIQEATKRAKQYKTRTEFSRKDSTSYRVLIKNKPGVLNEIFGDSKTRKITIDECIDIAKKYKTRSKLAEDRGGVYETLRKNNMLDEIFPIKQKNQFG